MSTTRRWFDVPRTTTTRALRWVQANRTMLSNAGAMVGTVGVNAVLGFAFWWFAAQHISAAQVGIAAAAIAAMQLIGTISMLGLGTLLISQLPRQKQQRGALIATALLLAGGVGMLLGTGFAITARWLSPELAALARDPLIVVLFGAGVGITAVTLVLDQALIGLLWGDIQFWRNASFASVKLGLLVLAAATAAQASTTIYITWLLGNLASLAVVAGCVVLLKHTRLMHWPQPSLLQGLARSAFDHHTLNLALQAPGLLLPVLVTALLSAEINARFYIAWMIAGLAFVAPFALSVALFAVATAAPEMLPAKLRMSLVLSAGIGAVANLVLWIGGGHLLGVFGSAYAAEAGAILRLLSLGVFGIIVKDHFVAVHRARGDVTRARGAVIVGMLIEIGFPVIGAVSGGITGFTLGWLAALAVQAVYMAPTLVRAIQSPTATPAPS